MKSLLLAAALVAGTFAATTAASAMPALSAGPADSAATLVVQGCGPGGHRDYYGRCVPNFRRPPPFRRFCPPGLHRDRFGRCIPNF